MTAPRPDDGPGRDRLAVLAHDLRNALTALRLQTEVAATDLGPETTASLLRLADRVENAAEALLREHSRTNSEGDH